MWRHALAAVGEAVLEGFARVKCRCSAIGRNTMSVDLQEAMHTLKSTVPPHPDLQVALDSTMRHVDTYIKVGLK